MSELSCYEQLGVSESASFEEIQEARTRMSELHSGDRKQVDLIEAAYDQILMQRLRQRQEGKIKVPERIRFAEREVRTMPTAPSTPTKEAPDWLQRLLDTPSRADIIWPAGVFFALSLLSLLKLVFPALDLAVGICVAIYFLNRKEKKFARAVVITMVALLGGLLIGVPLGTWLASSLNVPFTPYGLAASFTFFILWLVSSFLR